MNYVSLFSGIGGIDLGLDRAGFRCVAQVEIDPYCRRVLAKHWPDVPRFEDVRTFTKECVSERVDLIAGGFPCQDISSIGRRAGIGGDRSGLWGEYRRIIREIRPRHVLVENVSALLNRGLDSVLGDLAASGYDSEWDCIPAAAVGAPHLRDRVFVVATDTNRVEYENGSPADWRATATHVHPHSHGVRRREGVFNLQPGESVLEGGGWWAVEPAVGRMAYGVPARVDRLRGLGNAVVPQVAEWIGRRILESAREAVPA